MEFITVDGEMGALDRFHDLGLFILLIVDFEIFYLVMNINTYMTFLQSLQSWNISFNGQKGWDTKQILFMLSPLPYFVLKMQWDTWDKLAA